VPLAVNTRLVCCQGSVSNVTLFAGFGYLLDEDHRIAGDHAEQRQNAEDRDKAERLAKNE
jgi:hypothetical protein